MGEAHCAIFCSDIHVLHLCTISITHTEPPQLTDVRAERLDAETMNVSWTPLTLVQAMGFVRYRISYQPQVNRKRQSGSVVVGGDRSFETIDGLMSGVVYDVTVEPINTDPNGQDLSAAGSPRTVVAEGEVVYKSSCDACLELRQNYSFICVSLSRVVYS